MPEFISLNPAKDIPVPVATESELLEFANKVRLAGGAKVLEALLPSRPSAAKQCLIANALNFSCDVYPGEADPAYDDEARVAVWYMYLPHNMEPEKAMRIANSTHCPLIYQHGSFRLRLPVHIGNAAAAFDKRLAFTNYVAKPGELDNYAD